MEHFTRPWNGVNFGMVQAMEKGYVLNNLVYIKLTASSDCQSLKWYM